MKKRVYIYLFIVAVLIFVFWLILIKKNKIESNVPNYADVIICVDKQNIRNSILSHYLYNPSEFFSKEDSINKDFGSYGIEIPNYMLLFAANNVDKGSLFTELKLINKQLLVDFLLRNEFSKATQNGYDIFERGGKVNIRVYMNRESNQAVLSAGFFNSNSNSFKVVDDLFNKTNLLPKDNVVFEKLRTSNNHITVLINESKYVKEQSFLAINFLKDKVEVKGEISNQKKYFFNGNTHVISAKTNLFNLSANLEGLFFKELIESVNKVNFNKKTNLNLDTLTHYFKPKLSFNLKDIHTSFDTGISYTYDDNFNAIEEEIITSKQTPSFSIELNKNRGGVFNYFLNDSIIKMIQGNYLFTPYPLQQTFVTDNEKQILLSTNKNEYYRSSSVKSTNFIDANGNLSKLKRFDNLERFSLHFTQKHSIEINGELLFKNKKTHAIFSILDMFKQ